MWAQLFYYKTTTTTTATTTTTTTRNNKRTRGTHGDTTTGSISKVLLVRTLKYGTLEVVNLVGIFYYNNKCDYSHLEKYKKEVVKNIRKLLYRVPI